MIIKGNPVELYFKTKMTEKIAYFTKSIFLRL